jgi:integrase
VHQEGGEDIGFRFHDFRHDAATKLLRETGNLKTARLLDHASITTTARVHRGQGELGRYRGKDDSCFGRCGLQHGSHTARPD